MKFLEKRLREFELKHPIFAYSENKAIRIISIGRWIKLKQDGYHRKMCGYYDAESGIKRGCINIQIDADLAKRIWSSFNKRSDLAHNLPYWMVGK